MVIQYSSFFIKKIVNYFFDFDFFIIYGKKNIKKSVLNYIFKTRIISKYFKKNIKNIKYFILIIFNFIIKYNNIINKK